MNSPSKESPAKRYRYRSMKDDKAIARVRQIVVESKLYFAAASTFNDPFELCPTFSFKASPEETRAEALIQVKRARPDLTGHALEMEVRAYQTFLSTPDTAEKFAASLADDFAKQHTDTVGVCCFTGQRDNLLVWAHYADSHAGVCLEFDGACPAVEDAQEVLYAEERVPINLLIDTPREMNEKALLTKSLHWAYEEEWRALRMRAGTGFAQFQPEHLTGIILGARATEATEQVVRGLIAERTAPCALYRASVSPSRFELIIKPIA